MRKTALITGATSGIGLAYARYFAERGYDLVLTGTRDLLRDVAAELVREYGVRVEPYVGRIVSLEDIDKLVDFLGEREISVLVNNAGFGVRGAFFANDTSTYFAMVNLHVVLSLRLVGLCLPAMLRDGEGTIVNVSSDSATLSFPGNAVYAGTKAFLRQFSEGLFLDLKKARSPVRVIAVCPGLTHTEFHGKMNIPKSRQVDHGLFRWGSPDDVVKKSIRDLTKGRALSMTGGLPSALMEFLYCVLPKGAFYALVLRMFK